MPALSPENARALLGIAEQRRQHWSNTITALNVLALTLLLGIGTFFLKGFFDYGYPENQSFGFSYFVMAAGLSSIAMASWRWYARYLDNIISNLYPEIMQYEQILNVPSNAGITGYLSNQQKEIGNVLPKLQKAKRISFVKQLVKDRKIGRRGHTLFDIGVLVLIVCSLFIALVDIYILYDNELILGLITVSKITDIPIVLSKDIGYFLIVISLGIHLFTFFRYQRAPTKAYVDEIVKS